jgi:stress response protein YsnF
VALTKEQIKNAPEFDEDRYSDPAYLDELARYYTVTSTTSRF